VHKGTERKEMKKIKTFFANIWNWIKSLFGFNKVETTTPVEPTPVVPSNAVGAALAEELNKVAVPAPKKAKTTKKVTKKTSKKKA
jgi:hypothetical protein